MAIVKATLLAEIASDLNDFGDWSEANDGYLERQLFKAVDDLWKAYQWAFTINSTSLAVTSGNLGPYPQSGSLPADFDALVTEEKINKYYAYDAYGVPPPVPDDSYGQRFPVVLDRVLNKIRFLTDPGTGTRTLYYIRLLTTVAAALALIPDKVSLKKFLTARTAHYALVNTEDFANQARTYWEQSEMLLNREVKRDRKGASRQDTRTLLGASGNPAYYGIQTGQS